MTGTYVFGDVQGAGAASSSLQVSSLPLSLAANSKVGELSLLGLTGASVIVVVGATVSTVHV